MEELNKRIEIMRDELLKLEQLKATYEQNPMKFLEDEVNYMRSHKATTTKQIIDTIINHVKTHGFN